MDHHQIDAEDFVERYVLAALDAEELRDFEEHFLDCPRCLERLEIAGRLRDALRLAAAQDSIRLAAAATWKRRLMTYALPIAALLVMAISLLFAWRALDKAQAISTQAQRVEKELEQKVADLGAKILDEATPRLLPDPVHLVATRSVASSPALVLDRTHFPAGLVLQIDFGPPGGEGGDADQAGEIAEGHLVWRHGDQTLWRHDAPLGSVRHGEEFLRLAAPNESLPPGLHVIELLGDDERVLRRWPFEVR